MAITPVFTVTWCWKQLLIFLCKSYFFQNSLMNIKFKFKNISLLILFEQKYVKITETSSYHLLGLNVSAHCKKKTIVS